MCEHLHLEVFEDEVVATILEELLFEMLWRMQVLARRISPLTLSLDGVEAAHDASVLDLDVGWRVGEAALVIRSCALVTRELTAYIECQPARVLDGTSRGRRRTVQHRTHDGVHDGHQLNYRELVAGDNKSDQYIAINRDDNTF